MKTFQSSVKQAGKRYLLHLTASQSHKSQGFISDHWLNDQFPEVTTATAEVFFNHLKQMRSGDTILPIMSNLCLSSTTSNRYHSFWTDQPVNQNHFAPVKSSFQTQLVFKICFHPMVPNILYNINCSVSTGTFLSCFKHAIVQPLLKKSTLGTLVSKLQFLSKI